MNLEDQPVDVPRLSLPRLPADIAARVTWVQTRRQGLLFPVHDDDWHRWEKVVALEVQGEEETRTEAERYAFRRAARRIIGDLVEKAFG